MMDFRAEDAQLRESFCRIVSQGGRCAVRMLKEEDRRKVGLDWTGGFEAAALRVLLSRSRDHIEFDYSSENGWLL